MSRQRASELELSEDELIIARTELDELHDDLYVLACAVDDAERDLGVVGDTPTPADLSEILRSVLDAAMPLRNRELSAPSAPPE